MDIYRILSDCVVIAVSDMKPLVLGDPSRKKSKKGCWEPEPSKKERGFLPATRLQSFSLRKAMAAAPQEQVTSSSLANNRLKFKFKSKRLRGRYLVMWTQSALYHSPTLHLQLHSKRFENPKVLLLVKF